MKKILLLIFVLSIFNNCLLYGENQTEKLVRKSNSIYRIVNDKLIKLDNKAVTVKPKEGKELSEKIRTIRSNILGYIDVEVPNDIDIEDFVANLKSTGDYEVVKYNEIAEIAVSPNDAQLSNQWYLGAINMYSAWNITTGSSNIKVAVIDNGFDCDHVDLGYGYDNYRNINPTLGYDYYQMSSTSMTKKDHGTRVAGIISAKTNNGTGIAGVAGGYGSAGVKILPFCVTDGSETGINMGLVDDAICLAVDNGAKVINMSFGSLDTNLSHHVDVVDAIDYAYSHGVTLVSITHNYSISYVCFPACYDKVIAIGAMNQNYQKSDFSNYGNGLDLVAPGTDIYSTKKNNDYNYEDGTSFAAPQVAGVVALMLSVNPDLTPIQIKSKLRQTCTKLSGYSYDNNGWNNYVGYGLLNAYDAVCSALSGDIIVGPTLFNTNGVYSIVNLPSGVTVEWSLSDSYYNQNCLQQNYPSTNQCTITRDFNHDMMNATLTANIKYNGVTVQTLTKAGIYAYAGFRGHYTSYDLSGDIDYSYSFYVRPNYITDITSQNFYGASVTYDSYGTVPNNWEFSSQYGYLRFIMPTNNGGIPVVINVNDCCGNYYQLYAIPQNFQYLNVSSNDNGITITLNEDGDSERGSILEQAWTVEIRNATTGALMTTLSSTSRSKTISTAGWPKGIYAVKATIGKEVLTEKVMVRYNSTICY